MENPMFLHDIIAQQQQMINLLMAELAIRTKTNTNIKSKIIPIDKTIVESKTIPIDDSKTQSTSFIVSMSSFPPLSKDTQCQKQVKQSESIVQQEQPDEHVNEQKVEFVNSFTTEMNDFRFYPFNNSQKKINISKLHFGSDYDKRFTIFVPIFLLKWKSTDKYGRDQSIVIRFNVPNDDNAFDIIVRKCQSCMTNNIIDNIDGERMCYECQNGSKSIDDMPQYTNRIIMTCNECQSQVEFSNIQLPKSVYAGIFCCERESDNGLILDPMFIFNKQTIGKQ